MHSSRLPLSTGVPRPSRTLALWRLSRDGDPVGLRLYERHYSARRYQDGRRRLFVGPGEKTVLLSPGGDALLVWRRCGTSNGGLLVLEALPPTGHQESSRATG